MARSNASMLIETADLADRLEELALRVFDCTVLLEVEPDGLRISSGREVWLGGHIPGSGFLDLLTELSDPDSPHRFMLPSADRFAGAMSAHGVADGAHVVLYDRYVNMWAARVWWMLRAYGFDDAVVLDGGWTKWTQEGRPVESGAVRYPRASFAARPREGVFVDRDAVLAGLAEPATCLVNGLGEDQHRGTGPTVPGGRPGHIPGSGNVPAVSLVDPSTHAYLGEAELRALLAGVGAVEAGRVITYCGGGIAASSVAFALELIGHEDVSIYDASLEEWATDPNLPIETG